MIPFPLCLTILYDYTMMILLHLFVVLLCVVINSVFYTCIFFMSRKTATAISLCLGVKKVAGTGRLQGLFIACYPCHDTLTEVDNSQVDETLWRLYLLVPLLYLTSTDVYNNHIQSYNGHQ
ncbi:hypothetical protein BDW74DRAFT_93880 [Aspergillus multicolor]|uniref:uncharacterized protein n=1 Tax=Aspergillus multicolor TaxID=41759 RepID=UPI003CCC9D26